MEKMSPWKTKGSLDWWLKKQLIKDGLQECNKRAMEQQKLYFISQCVSLFSSQKQWPSTMFPIFTYIQDVSKTSDGFWNLKISMPT